VGDDFVALVGGVEMDLKQFAQPGRKYILFGPASPGEHFSSGVHRVFHFLRIRAW
jgi:hypothetical protein